MGARPVYLSFAAAGVLPLLLSCSGEGPAKAARSEEPPRSVRVAEVTRGELARTVTVTGTLAAEDEVVLGLKVGGRLAEIPVDMGSRVRRGAILARLAPADFDLRVAQSEAALEQARSRLGLRPGDPDRAVQPEEIARVKQAQAVLTEARLRRDRARALFVDQLLSQAELDGAEASYQVAEASTQDALEEANTRLALWAQRRSELDLARQQRDDAVLVAPFDGAVRVRHASPGQVVAAGESIITLVRLHPLRLRLDVPEREAAGLRVGQDVSLSVEGEKGEARGRLVRLSPAIEEGSRTLKVEAEVPNAAGELRPGAFATATIRTTGAEPVTFVPEAALRAFAGAEKVFVVRDGRAVETVVRSGRRHEGQVEIREGVTAGDTVVLDPGNLVDGERVTDGS